MLPPLCMYIMPTCGAVVRGNSTHIKENVLPFALCGPKCCVVCNMFMCSCLFIYIRCDNPQTTVMVLV